MSNSPRRKAIKRRRYFRKHAKYVLTYVPFESETFSLAPDLEAEPAINEAPSNAHPGAQEGTE